eukprot:14673815-Ditylum_brightwellii.AAC.1
MLYLQGWVQQSQVVEKPTSHCPTPYHHQKEKKEQTTPLNLCGWASSHCKRGGKMQRYLPTQK